MRIALVLLAVLGLSFGAYRAWLGFQPPEDHIRWRIEDAFEGFHDTRIAPCILLFTPDFAEESTGYVRADVKRALVAAFFRRVDPNDGRFLMSAQLDDLRIAVEGETAEVSFAVQVFERPTSESDPRGVWSFDFEGSMRDGDDGWRFHRGRIDTRDGALPR